IKMWDSSWADNEQAGFGIYGAAIGSELGGLYFRYHIDGTSASGLQLRAGGGDRMTILNSGNVGIGQTVPGAKLTVNNPTTAGKVGSAGDAIYTYSNSAANAAISAEQGNAGGYAGYFSGKVAITSNLTTGGTLTVSTAGGNVCLSDGSNCPASGATTFLGLTDTPSVFQAGKLVRVNTLGTLLEFADPQVGTLGVSGKWCTTDGTVINCTSDTPSFSEADAVIGNEVTDAANTTLTRSGSGTAADPYKLGLNLNNANIWAAAQTFSANTNFPGSGVWNTSGNVGIGITNPSAKLAVGGTGSAGDGIAVYTNSGNSALYTQQNGAGYAGYFAGTNGRVWIESLAGGCERIYTAAGSGELKCGTAPAETDPQVGTLGVSGKWCTTDGTVINCTSDAPSAGIGGSGTDNYIPRWNGANALENSIIYDDGVNIGIGRNNPLVKLHIGVSGAGSGIRVGGTANAGFDYSGNTGDFYLGGDNGQAGNFYVKDSAGALKVAINSDTSSYFMGGNIGIGTIAPGDTTPPENSGGGTLFDANSRTVEVRANAFSAATGLFLRRNDGLTGLDLWTYGGDGESYIDNRWYGQNKGITFRVNTNTPASMIEAMRITGSGNVGIGQTNPSAKLTVSGQDPLTGNAVAAYANSALGSALYAQQDNLSGYAGYFSGKVAVDSLSGTAIYGAAHDTSGTGQGVTGWSDQGLSGTGVTGGRLGPGIGVSGFVSDSSPFSFAGSFAIWGGSGASALNVKGNTAMRPDGYVGFAPTELVDIRGGNLSLQGGNLIFYNDLRPQGAMCAIGQILKKVDTNIWGCAADDASGGVGVGDIEAVWAGTGLTGGGSSGEVTLNVGAGTGISVGSDIVSVKNNSFTCSSANESLKSINIDTGTVTCEVDDLGGGSGLWSDQGNYIYPNNISVVDKFQIADTSGDLTVKATIRGDDILLGGPIFAQAGDLELYTAGGVKTIDLDGATGNIIATGYIQGTYTDRIGNPCAAGKILKKGPSGWDCSDDLQGGAGGAPIDATYVILPPNNLTLTNERLLTAGTGISIVDGGANGNITFTNTGLRDIITGKGLQKDGSNNVGIQICATNQIMKYNGTSNQWECADRPQPPTVTPSIPSEFYEAERYCSSDGDDFTPQEMGSTDNCICYLQGTEYHEVDGPLERASCLIINNVGTWQLRAFLDGCASGGNDMYVTCKARCACW
ncbi:MAG: hypothetical protein ABIG08_03580, partial [bacterium]